MQFLNKSGRWNWFFFLKSCLGNVFGLDLAKCWVSQFSLTSEAGEAPASSAFCPALPLPQGDVFASWDGKACGQNVRAARHLPFSSGTVAPMLLK